jgi:hypothetical protein
MASELETRVYAHLIAARLRVAGLTGVSDENLCAAMELLRARWPGIDEKAVNLMVTQGVKP